jgi:hypothetical protein
MASDGKWYPPELHPAWRGAPPPLVVLADTDRPRLWPSIAMLILGSSCVIAGFVLFFVVGVLGLVNSTVYDTPAHVTLQCQVGDYLVYQHTATTDSGPGFSISHGGPLTIGPDQVEVIGPDGSRVPTWSGTGSETITKGSQTYSSAVGFHAAMAGTYSVAVQSTMPTSVIIAPSLGSQVAHAALWLLLSAAGGLIAVVGLVLLIVGSSRRARAGRSASMATPQGPTV